MSSITTVRRTVAPWPWTEADTAAVAFRCNALGASGAATVEFLGSCRRRQVRRLKAYVDGVSDTDLADYLAAAHAASEAHRGTRRRGDIISIRRRVKRWPWRTRSDQPHAGVIGRV